MTKQEIQKLKEFLVKRIERGTSTESIVSRLEYLRRMVKAGGNITSMYRLSCLVELDLLQDSLQSRLDVDTQIQKLQKELDILKRLTHNP